MINTLNNLAEAGEMFGLTEKGELVSVQELLSQIRGRECSFYEAVSYVIMKKKQAFITKIKKRANQIKYERQLQSTIID